MNKAYERINWENYPSENTALNETNLNKMDAALNEVDNRVVAHETTKLDVATANSMVKNVSFNERSGIFTITYLNGSTKELDTKLEKIATNFVYDEERQKLVLTLIDGTTQEIDMSALITQYEFENSAYISFTVVNGKVKAEIINGSITADKLQPNFLADVTLQANSAKTSEQNAKISEENAKQSEINAKNYADSAEPVASTANGLNPTLANSTHAPFITFKGKGATEQQTYSGKNLLNNTATSKTENGITFTVNSDGSVTANGTATAQARLYFTSGLVFEEDTILSIQGATNGGVSGYYSGGNVFKEEKTVSAGTSYRTFFIFVAKGSTVNNVTVYPMIRPASIADATYEPYVGGIASPNPSYPQEIYGVGESGSLSVKSTGKNLLENAKTSTTYNGITYTVNADKSITINGTATAIAYMSLPITLGAGTYKLVGCPSGSNGGANFNQMLSIGGIENGSGYEFTLEEETTLTVYTARVASGKTVSNVVFKPMITTDLDATYDDYEPYTETTANIPLNAPLYESDYLRLNMDGTGEEGHKQFEMILDGSESWNVTGSTDSMYYYVNIGDYGSVIDNKVICSHFIQTSISTGNTNIGINVLNSPTAKKSRIVIRPDIDEVTDIETWKAWLSENTPKVVYEKAEPTVTPLTAGQIAEFEKLRTFDGTTHITCEAESEVQYFCDSVSGKAVASVVEKAKDLEKNHDALYDRVESLNVNNSKAHGAFDIQLQALRNKDIQLNTAITELGQRENMHYEANAQEHATINVLISELDSKVNYIIKNLGIKIPESDDVNPV